MVLFAVYNKNGDKLSTSGESNYIPSIDKLSDLLTEVVNRQNKVIHKK